MDHVEETLLKRGLFRLGAAETRELANFSGASGDVVDAYLETRPDMVLPRGAEGGAGILRKEAREALMNEIKTGIERDPERLSDYLQPDFLVRLRSSLGLYEAILDDIASGAIKNDRLLPARIARAGEALSEMRRHGRDVSDEEQRLAACKTRLAMIPSDVSGVIPTVG